MLRAWWKVTGRRLGLFALYLLDLSLCGADTGPSAIQQLNVVIEPIAQLTIVGAPSLNPRATLTATSAGSYVDTDSALMGFLVAGRGAATFGLYVSEGYNSLQNAGIILSVISNAASGTPGSGPNAGQGTATSAPIAVLGGDLSSAAIILTDCQGNYFNIPITFTLDATHSKIGLIPGTLTIAFIVS